MTNIHYRSIDDDPDHHNDDRLKHLMVDLTSHLE